MDFNFVNVIELGLIVMVNILILDTDSSVVIKLVSEMNMIGVFKF